MSLTDLPQVSPTRSLLATPRDEFLSWLADRRQAAMRLKQIHRWLIMGRAKSFEEMTDLPKKLREDLQREFVPFSTSIARLLVSSDGTEKLLIRLEDGQLIECVLLKEADRRTVCISTQVGCGMGCVFCASGIGGVVRNLRADEIIEQLLHARNRLPEEERITHIVVMGMGEPMANLDSLLVALEQATSPQGLGISARHIHISTVGIPGRIRQLADLGKAYHLAVSLHAPDDVLRSKIVPTNDKIGLDSILEAADYFQSTTGRQVTYEYVLLHEVNDRPEHAARLGRLLAGRQAHINLIPFNDVSGLGFQRLTTRALEDFVAILKQHHVSVKVRKRKGADIDAACGQLRREALRGPENRELQEGKLPPLPEPATAAGVE